MKLHPTTLAAIIEHCATEYPREACGLIVRIGKRDTYQPCRNVAATASEHFMMHHEDAQRAEDAGEVVALVHSHPDDSATPSEGDRAACEASGMPWLIFEVREGVVNKDPSLTTPCGWQAPLIGRMFFHGVLDCMTLVHDFYKREFDIDLPNPYREDDWWNRGQNLYIENYPSAGFYKLPEDTEMQYGDVALMQIRSPVANHSGIFLGTKNIQEALFAAKVPGAMLHHLYGRPSERIVYGGYWAESTVAIIRHKEIKNGKRA